MTTSQEMIPASAATDTKRASRLGLWALGLAFGGILVWAALAPLDEGVPTVGQVALDTNRKTVQHLRGGMVASLHVREGQVVKAGDELLRIDDALTRADYEAIRQRYLGLRVMQGRLRAEQAGQTVIAFHADVEAAKGDPTVRKQMDTQQQLLMARRHALETDLRILSESVSGQEADIVAARAVLSSRRAQIGSLQQDIDSIKPLVDEGYAPRTRLTEMQRQLADLHAAESQIKGNESRALSSISELKQRMRAREQEYKRDIESQLADVEREVFADEQKYAAARDELNRTAVQAPVDGQVIGLSVHSVGAVIQAGQKLMDIVPENQSLVVEAHVPPNLIDKVHAGMLADVRFATFADAPQLVVEGRVDSVSGDLLQDPEHRTSYYLARLAVTSVGMEKLAGRRLQPGMPADIVIKTGQRSMLTYLLHPLLRRVAASLKE